MYESLKRIYKPKYIAANAIIAVLYYFVIKTLLSIQQRGIPLSTAPVYLIYLLAITSSVTLTIAIYSIGNTRRNNAKVSASTVSSVTALLGGVVAGCSCQAAIMAGALALVVNSGEALYITSVVAGQAALIFTAMILINIFVAAYYVNRLSKPYCMIKKK